MHKLVSLISLFFLCHHATWAQTAVLDSIQTNIAKATTDSAKLWHKMQYAMHFAKTDFEGGLKKMREAREGAQQLGLQYLSARAIQMLSTIYYYKGDYINSIAHDEQAEKAFLSLPQTTSNQFGLAAVYNGLGATYSLINETEKAQEYYMRSVAIFEKIKDSGALLIAYFNIAFIYIDMQEWKEALSYFYKAMRYKNSKSDKDIIVQVYARAAAMHFRLQQIQQGKKLLDSCKNYFSQSAPLDIAKIYYHNAGGEYKYALGKGQDALIDFRAAADYGKRWNDPYFTTDNSWEIGRTFLLLNETDSAEKYLQEALDTANRYSYLPKVRFILNDWCKYYDRIGNFKKANELRSLLLSFTDSLVNIQNHNRILLNDARFSTQQKEALIQQLEKDKTVSNAAIKQRETLNYVLLGCALITIIFSLLLFRNYKQQQKLQLLRISELEAQQQLAATEAVLKGEEQERTRLAKDLHDGLGGLLSGIKYSFQTMKGNLIMTPENQQAFERSMDMLDSSIKEMRRVAHNMMPEALVKFGLDTALTDFCSDINQSGVIRVHYQSAGLQDQPIEQSAAITIYRIVQELINNIIKHAAASQAIVQVNKTGETITVTVEDDGIGFDTATLQAGKGVGWSNIQSRVNFLKGRLDVKSVQGKGTSVYITFGEEEQPGE
ncbi:MAG: tetratricopeptide repeat-containing sensor histidine kinase [Agriterribacter sp.]